MAAKEASTSSSCVENEIAGSGVGGDCEEEGEDDEGDTGRVITAKMMTAKLKLILGTILNDSGLIQHRTVLWQLIKCS